MTLLQRLRIFIGIDTEADRRARHRDMLEAVQRAANEYDRRDTLDDTKREKRRGRQ